MYPAIPSTKLSDVILKYILSLPPFSRYNSIILVQYKLGKSSTNTYTSIKCSDTCMYVYIYVKPNCMLLNLQRLNDTTCTSLLHISHNVAYLIPLIYCDLTLCN